MWGGFMDKALDMAANLDKQINESVGLEGEANSASATNKSEVSAAALSTAAATAAADEDNANAWNDDFDDGFDDDDDDGIPESKPIAAATPKPAISQPEEEKPSPAPVVAAPAPPPAVASPVPEPATTATPPEPANETPAAPAEGWDDSELDLGAEEPVASPAPASTPPVQAQTARFAGMLSSLAHQAEAGIERGLLGSPKKATPSSKPEKPVTKQDGWTGDDDDLAGISDKAEDDPMPLAPTSPTKAAYRTAALGSMFSSLAKQAEATIETSLKGANSPQKSEETTQPVEEQQGWAQDEIDIEEEETESSPTKEEPPSESVPSPDVEDSVDKASVEGNEENVPAEFAAPDTTEKPSSTDNEVASPSQSSKQSAHAFGSMFSSLAKKAEASIGKTIQQEKKFGAFLQSFPVGGAKGAEQEPAPVDDNDGAWEGDDLAMLDDDDEVPEKPPVQVAEQQPTEQAALAMTSPPEMEVPKAQPTSSGGAPIGNIEDDPRYKELKEQLSLREQQLANKSEQLTQLQIMSEQQEQELRNKIAETKEEAKKRIQKARERCEVAETKLKSVQSSQGESAAEQANIIAELREEGQKLAMKQSQMEQSVRTAKLEARDYFEQLEKESTAKTQALEKISKLEVELKTTKDALASARKGESQAGKLENDLLAARSDAEMKAATILTLQQEIKELKEDNKELRVEVEKTRKTALQEAQQEKKSLRREHNDIIADLEQKLRTTEREAGVREDALRHEVSELRKRWQDAVRRADALSMDVQSSTAPLLRQLESMERQNRARSAAWAELENRLRSELEDAVIQSETATKERSEFKTKFTRLERSVNEYESELKLAKRTVDDQTAKIEKLESQIENLEADAAKRQEEYVKVERLANEGVMRVRSEMTQTVVDSEERYRGQIDKLEADLRVEREKRTQLESQVSDLLENAGMIMAPEAPAAIRREAKPKKLRQAEGQAEILAGALGFDSDDDDDDDESTGRGMDRRESQLTGNSASQVGGMNSFAALEQLSSRLKAATIELEALRSNLRESEKSRDSLVEELGECRVAKEKLPLFEAKVKELTQDNREKELEVQGLREDIAEVRELYRTQLNVLLEEKASAAGAEKEVSMNGTAPTGHDVSNDASSDAVEPETPSPAANESSLEVI